MSSKALPVDITTFWKISLSPRAGAALPELLPLTLVTVGLQAEPSAHGWKEWKTTTVGGGMKEYLAWPSVQPSRPFCVSPQAVLQLSPVLCLIHLQSSPQPWSPVCKQVPSLLCALLCGFLVQGYLLPSFPLGELRLIFQGSAPMSPSLGSLLHFRGRMNHFFLDSHSFCPYLFTY